MDKRTWNRIGGKKEGGGEEEERRYTGRGNERKRGRAELDDEIMHVLGDSG